MKELAAAEQEELQNRFDKLEADIKELLVPKDPNDSKNAMLEIRAGTGGDEAALFAADLYRMYSRFAERIGWKMEVVTYNESSGLGGLKEVIVSVTGKDIYGTLKYESGVHRVQRVPQTEGAGRVHTSTITVAVIPEVEEVEVKIDMKDIRIDVMRASGAGGQSVNRTESAVRLHHEPSGIIVHCQEGKSQTSNKEKAFKILYSKLQMLEDQKVLKEASDARLEQIGTGDRSERIRTYNFPQTRVTDHRIGLTTHALNEIMAGDLSILVDSLIAHYQAEALKKQTS